MKTRFYIFTAAFLLIGGFSTNTMAAAYWGCNGGYNFQVNNNAARCYKQSSVVYADPLPCGNITIPAINQSIGHFFRRDYQRTADKCVGTFKIGPVSNTNAVDLACPVGYSLEVRSGNDRCRKTVPADVKAPTTQVNR